jgi:hypothetical protein
MLAPENKSRVMLSLTHSIGQKLLSLPNLMARDGVPPPTSLGKKVRKACKARQFLALLGLFIGIRAYMPCKKQART